MHMKLDCVLTAVNENTLYLEFIPIFIQTWKKLYPSIDIKIILISNMIPKQYLVYEENIILFPPINNVLTSFTAQYIRLLYPCVLQYKNGVMITDIDMLPMNNSYYTKNIENISNDKFIYMRKGICEIYKQYAMCYNVACPETWKNVFKINSICDIRNRIKEIFDNNIIKEGHNNEGWCIDQLHLYKYINEWRKQTNNFISISDNETNFYRLCRSQMRFFSENTKENISKGLYTDYHCLRPMSNYDKINKMIYNLLIASPFWSVEYLNSLNFVKSNICSPINNGLFDISIDYNENIIYKRIKQKVHNIDYYKSIIYNLKNDEFMKEYIYKPEQINIEDDGSYFSKYIKNGIRLYDINCDVDISNNILTKLLNSLHKLQNNLISYSKNNNLYGDWALHNLMYCVDNERIYNVDLEGFYTYPYVYNNGNCDINHCLSRFFKLYKRIKIKQNQIKI